jgi:hypothetical protein
MLVGDALERLARGLKFTFLKRMLADGSQGSGVDRVDFQNPRPELEGLGFPPRLRRLRGLRLEGADLYLAFPCILHRLDSRIRRKPRPRLKRRYDGARRPDPQPLYGSVRFALTAGRTAPGPAPGGRHRAESTATPNDISRGARCS